MQGAVSWNNHMYIQACTKPTLQAYQHKYLPNSKSKLSGLILYTTADEQCEVALRIGVETRCIVAYIHLQCAVVDGVQNVRNHSETRMNV
jgi:hypothetical protein